MFSESLCEKMNTYCWDYQCGMLWKLSSLSQEIQKYFVGFLKNLSVLTFNHKNNTCIGSSSEKTIKVLTENVFYFGNCEMNYHVVSCFRNFGFGIWVLGKNWLHFFFFLCNQKISYINLGKMLGKYRFIETSSTVGTLPRRDGSCNDLESVAQFSSESSDWLESICIFTHPPFHGDFYIYIFSN